jgi:hypothetical protein
MAHRVGRPPAHLRYVERDMTAPTSPASDRLAIDYAGDILAGRPTITQIGQTTFYRYSH